MADLPAWLVAGMGHRGDTPEPACGSNQSLELEGPRESARGVSSDQNSIATATRGGVERSAPTSSL